MRMGLQEQQLHAQQRFYRAQARLQREKEAERRREKRAQLRREESNRRQVEHGLQEAAATDWLSQELLAEAEPELPAGNEGNETTTTMTTSVTVSATRLSSTSTSQTTAAPPLPGGAPGIARGADREHSLLCFSVMRPTGHERDLVSAQIAKGWSIFACDRYILFSNISMLLGPRPPKQVQTTIIPTDLHAASGRGHHSLNGLIFVRAWEWVGLDGSYRGYDWVVKVDPDCVFFPSRLRWRLKHTLQSGHEEATSGVYIRNCGASAGSSLMGSVEALSRKAVEVFSHGLRGCMAQLAPQHEGEPKFVQLCLDHHGVKHKYLPTLVGDEYCEGHPRPCNDKRVAFHPFKTLREYDLCVVQAAGPALR